MNRIKATSISREFKTATKSFAEWEWTHKGTGISTPRANTYAFTYDAVNRLKESRDRDDDMDRTAVSKDKKAKK